MILAISAGILLSLLNALVSLFYSKRALKKKEFDEFNKIVLSSLVIRFFVMLALVWAGMMIFENHKLSFALALLTAAFVFMMLEILYLHKLAKVKKLQNR